METEQEGPKDNQSLPSPSESQSEPVRKKITYAKLVKEGRRFNIDLVSKVSILFLKVLLWYILFLPCSEKKLLQLDLSLIVL